MSEIYVNVPGSTRPSRYGGILIEAAKSKELLPSVTAPPKTVANDPYTDSRIDQMSVEELRAAARNLRDARAADHENWRQYKARRKKNNVEQAAVVTRYKKQMESMRATIAPMRHQRDLNEFQAKVASSKVMLLATALTIYLEAGCKKTRKFAAAQAVATLQACGLINLYDSSAKPSPESEAEAPSDD